MTELDVLEVWRDVPLSLIDPSPSPIREVDGANITEIRDSLDRFGLLQNLIVKPKPDGRYEVLAGNSRYYALKGRDVERVHCRIMPANLTCREAKLISLIENVHRQNMNPWEEGKAFLETGEPVEDLSRDLAKSVKYIEERVHIYQHLHPDLVQHIGKTLTTSNIIAICKYPKDKQLEVSQAVIEHRKRPAQPTKSGYGSGVGSSTGYDPGYGGYAVSEKDVCVCPRCGKPHMRR